MKTRMNYTSPSVLIKSRIARGIRQFLLVWGIASIAVYFLEPSIDGHATVLPLSFSTVAMCICFGAPLALIVWFAWRVLHFAFTH